jgi:FAD/FMN-containing dehydrogenase
VATQTYTEKVRRLREQWQSGQGQLRLRKRTVSNLFRYQPRNAPGRQLRRVRLDEFNRVIGLDPGARAIEVEGLATYETVVRYSLARGFLPLVAPELKNITVGGAIVGIGIESTGFRYGFVHDGLIEADVLLPGGDVVTVRADNEHAGLFHGLPNSYGTLGYILRARIALHPAKPYVHLRTREFDAPGSYLEAMKAATERQDVDFVEGLFFEDGRFLLSTGRMLDDVPRRDDIIRKNIYYRLVEQTRDIYLSTFDYVFRYDPDWFWNVPEGGVYDFFRKVAPKRFRTSGFYSRYLAVTRSRYIPRFGKGNSNTEPLIQDWEVPWERAEELIRFCLENVDLAGRPWAAVPIRSPGRAALYPVKPDALYFNLGSYCQAQRPVGMEPYHWTKVMDRRCFDLGGIKMLYSSTFLDRAEFDELYNGETYRQLKAEYDPESAAPSLYEKVVYIPR